MYNELKRAKEIYNCWTSKETIKLKRTMNEHPISVDRESEIESLYQYFAFKERDRT